MRSVVSKGLFLASAAVLLPGLAYAQDASPAPEEVIVTATKRPELAQQVPIPLSVLTPAVLTNQNINSVQGLTNVTPGLIYTTTGPNAMPSIRGVGTRSFSPGDSSPVALYVDNVYLPAEGAGMFEFGDVERIEVLKGPQGTLFGRNATGGAINIITRAPTDDTEYNATVGYGSYNERLANGYANGQLADHLDANISAFYQQDDGFAKNLVNNTYVPDYNDWGVRGKILWQPLSNLSITLEGDTVKIADPQSYMDEVYPGTTNKDVYLHPGALSSSTYGEAYSNQRPVADDKQRGGSLLVDYSFPDFDLKSLSAARNTITIGELDTDETSLNLSYEYLKTTNLTYTQEFTATSTGEGPFSWVAGLFFMSDTAERMPQFTPGAAPGLYSTVLARLQTIAGAPYAEATYKFDSNWSIVGGLRYSYETKHLVNGSGTNCFSDSCITPRSNAQHTWQAVNYRATVQYTVDPTLNFYATNSTGFKSGAYNSTAFSDTPVNPEDLTAYEIGMKSTRYGVSFDSDVFYYIDKGIQVQRSINPATGQSLLQNAAGAADLGWEASLDAPIDEHWSTSAGVTWLHDRYTSFPNADVFIPATTFPFGTTEISENEKGKPTFRSPDWSGNLDVTYNHRLFDGTFTGVAGLYYTSTYSFEPGYRVLQPSYATLHLQASWTSPNDRYTLTVWGDNVTNTHYYTIGSSNALLYSVVDAPPAWFGVKLTIRGN